MIGEAQKSDFFLQVKEAIKNEPMVIVPVTPENIERLSDTLADLSNKAMVNDGMLPITGNVAESIDEWIRGMKNVWIFGEKGKDFDNPENVLGFVNVYRPEDAHVAQINAWVPNRFKGAYTADTLIEMASFAKGYPQSAEAEFSANKLALAKVFYFEGKKQYGDIQAAAIWVTHNNENMLDSFDAEQMTKLGGKALGSMKYHPEEKVDSTCFLIPKQAFMNKLTNRQHGRS